METAKYKNIVFDFGSVLVDLNRPRCIENFHRLGVADIDTMLDASHQRGIFHRMDEGTISNADFRDALRAKSDRVLTDEEIDNAWFSFLDGMPTCRLEALLELKKRHHVYLLSNVGDLHWQWACRHLFPYRGHGVEDYFERIYLSYRLKVTKPDPAIFHAMLQDSGMRPEETFFIDDAPANCRVAESLGIATYTPQAREDWRHVFGLG